MIKSISGSFQSLPGVFQRSFSSKLIRLEGDAVRCNSILMAIEQSIAGDITDYYRSFDTQVGVNTVACSSFALESSLLKCSINNGEIVTAHPPMSERYVVLRYIGQSQVRLVTDPESKTKLGKDWGNSLLTFSSELTVANWHRLTKLVNQLAGKQVMSFNQSEKKVSVAASEFDTRLKNLYLLISEALRKNEGYKKVILLSRVEGLTSEDYDFLIRLFTSLADVDSVVYYNNDWNGLPEEEQVFRP